MTIHAFRIRVALSAAKRSIPDGTRAGSGVPAAPSSDELVGRSRSCRTSAPTRCRLRPCRSMKVSSSDSTERRSFGTFMRRRWLPTWQPRQPAIRAHDSTGPGWPRHLPATTLPSGADSDLRPEQSGDAGADGGQEVESRRPAPRQPVQSILLLLARGSERDAL